MFFENKACAVPDMPPPPPIAPRILVLPLPRLHFPYLPYMVFWGTSRPHALGPAIIPRILSSVIGRTVHDQSEVNIQNGRPANPRRAGALVMSQGTATKKKGEGRREHSGTRLHVCIQPQAVARTAASQTAGAGVGVGLMRVRMRRYSVRRGCPPAHHGSLPRSSRDCTSPCSG